MNGPVYQKGHKFHGPEGGGYILTRDVFRGEAIMADMFKAFGGAPEPKANSPLPPWLDKMLLVTRPKRL